MEDLLLVAIALLPLFLALGSLGFESRRDVMKSRLGIDDIVIPGKVSDPPPRAAIFAEILLQSTGMTLIGRLFEGMLGRAGYRHRLAGGIFVATLVGFMVVATTLFWIFVEPREPGSKPFVAAFVNLLVWLAGCYWLVSRMNNRMVRLQSNIPFWLDLHSTLVEGGLGLDAALAIIVEETAHSKEPLFMDLRQLHRDLMLGQNRIQAYRAFAERGGVVELGHVVAAIVQAQQLGSGMVDTLRAQADMMRNKIWEAANQRAEKLPIKLLFPTAIGVLPSMFVVTALPGMLHVVDYLGRNH